MQRKRRYLTEKEVHFASTFESKKARYFEQYKDHLLLSRGSRDALKVLERCTWEYADSENSAIDPKLTKHLDVIVHFERIEKRKWTIYDKMYTYQSLCNDRNVIKVQNSCLVCYPTKNGRFFISSLYITEETDPSIALALKYSKNVYKMSAKYHKKTKSAFYRRGANWKELEGGGWCRENAGTTPALGLLGENYLDGLQYYSGTTGAHVEYRSTKEEFLSKKWKKYAYHFVAMQACERRHVPQIFATRLRLKQESNLPGLIPGLPATSLAATTVGTSRSFACQLHSDSGRRGTTESIFWKHDTTGAPYSFFNSEANILFIINSCCCMYIPPFIEHGSVPNSTDEVEHGHEGLGFVLMTKNMLSTSSEYLKGAGEKLKENLHTWSKEFGVPKPN